jgi:hypothetical protein
VPSKSRKDVFGPPARTTARRGMVGGEGEGYGLLVMGRGEYYAPVVKSHSVAVNMGAASAEVSVVFPENDVACRAAG